MSLFAALISDLWADPHVKIQGGCADHDSEHGDCLLCRISVMARWNVVLAKRVLKFAADRSSGNASLVRQSLRSGGLGHHWSEIVSDLNRMDHGEAPFIPDVRPLAICGLKKTTTKSLICSASNRLYHNDIDGFAQAMALVILMCEQERYPEPREYAPGAGGRIEFQVNESLEAYSNLAKQCRQEYAMHGVDLSELWTKWEASSIEELRAIGEALRTGNYHGLAI